MITGWYNGIIKIEKFKKLIVIFSGCIEISFVFFFPLFHLDKEEAKHDPSLRHNALLVWAPADDIPNTKCEYSKMHHNTFSLYPSAPKFRRVYSLQNSNRIGCLNFCVIKFPQYSMSDILKLRKTQSFIFRK